MAAAARSWVDESGILHRMVRTNGIDMHIAEQGSGPVALLLHGFPETWYSWRHQLPALAAAGFRAVAPDMRGCGLTTAPDGAENYTAMDIVGDLAGLVEALGEREVLLVGHDWGARHAWDLCLLRPDLVRAVVALSVPFEPRLASGSVLARYRAALGDNFYMARFQRPGLAESDYQRCGTTNALRRIFAFGLKEGSCGGGLTEAELGVYSRSFARTGFTGALNPYRAMERSWELKAAWTGCGVNMPALFMVGEHDAVYDFPGMRDFIHGGDFQKFVPNLENIIVLQDSDHFIQQQRHQLVSHQIITFFGNTFRTRRRRITPPHEKRVSDGGQTLLQASQRFATSTDVFDNVANFGGVLWAGEVNWFIQFLLSIPSFDSSPHQQFRMGGRLLLKQQPSKLWALESSSPDAPTPPSAPTPRRSTMQTI